MGCTTTTTWAQPRALYWGIEPRLRHRCPPRQCRAAFRAPATWAFVQAGFLLPKNLLGPKLRVQPYASHLLASYEGLRDSDGEKKGVNIFDAGANFYIDGHNAKFTLNYRARPDFTLRPDTAGSPLQPIAEVPPRNHAANAGVLVSHSSRLNSPSKLSLITLTNMEQSIPSAYGAPRDTRLRMTTTRPRPVKSGRL